MPEYPDDADGAALRRVEVLGADMSRPMSIDFMVAVPDEAAGRAVAARANAAGFSTKVSRDEQTGAFTCYCTRTMVPTYEEIVAIQRELDHLAAPFGGNPDGWGTWGNAEERS